MIASLVILAALVPAAASAFDVTACGQLVPDGDVGVLQGDLVCTFDEGGIAIGRGATLQMNGHTVSADAFVNGQVAIGCNRGTCIIEGPGEVSGFGGAAIVGLAPSTLKIAGISVHDNGVGIVGERVRLVGVTLSANENWAASGRKLEAVNVVASANPGDGLGGYRVQLTDVVTSGNGGDGVRCNRITARRLTATDNVGYGISSTYQGHTKLIESTVTGNGTADVGSQHQPKLVDTTCGTSRRLSDAGANLGTWGLCAGD